jgi:hypothetical protein
VVVASCDPCSGGFRPGVLVVQDPGRVFVGAGTQILCYRGDDGQWKRQWRDDTSVGFWEWRQHGGVVLMSAELELAAWTRAGDLLWRTNVEPPWSYVVREATLHLDFMGRTSQFSLDLGPAQR